MIGFKKVLIFFAIVGFVASKSAVEISEISDNELKDSGFEEKLETSSKIIKELLEKSDSSKVENIGKIVYAIFKRSINVKCFEQKLEKLEWTTKFSELVGRSEGLNDVEKAEVVMMYAGVGVLCSNKLRPIEEFIFDALMAVGHLVRAFKDEPELEKYFFYLRCANKVAIDKKYWDFADYQLNTQLSGLETGICEDFTNMLEEAIQEKIKEGIKSPDGEDEIKLSECRQNTIKDSLPFLIKYLLLTQVELTPEAQEAEKENFIATHSKLSEQSLKCVMDDIMTVDVNKFTSLSSSGIGF